MDRGRDRVGSEVDPSNEASSIQVSEVADLGAHARAWDQLAAASPQPSPFLLSWWLEAQAAAELGASFVLVLEGDQLLGGLAVRLDRRLGVRRVRLLGAGHLAPDHLDVVAAPDRRAEVLSAIAGWFEEQPTFADLQGIAGDALVVHALPARRLVTDLSAAPYLTLRHDRDVPVGPIRRTRDLRRQFAAAGASGCSVPAGGRRRHGRPQKRALVTSVPCTCSSGATVPGSHVVSRPSPRLRRQERREAPSASTSW